MTRASITIAINAPAEAVWRVISDFGAACQYLDKVEDCTVEGEGVGARRTLTLADGGTLVERLETLDEAARRLSYALLTDTPFGNCLTTVSLGDLGPNQAALEWSATFESDGLPASEAVELLEGALAANCLALSLRSPLAVAPRGKGSSQTGSLSSSSATPPLTQRHQWPAYRPMRTSSAPCS